VEALQQAAAVLSGTERFVKFICSDVRGLHISAHCEGGVPVIVQCCLPGTSLKATELLIRSNHRAAVLECNPLTKPQTANNHGPCLLVVAELANVPAYPPPQGLTKGLPPCLPRAPHHCVHNQTAHTAPYSNSLYNCLYRISNLPGTTCMLHQGASWHDATQF